MPTKTNDFLFGHNPNEFENNSLGHRSKDLDKLNLNNYILFAGCSVTWGVGLHLEETYPYLTAKSLNLDYYNLAIPGSSLELAIVNIFSFLKNIKEKPKFIVLQYPGPYRFLLSDDYIDFKNIGPWVKIPEEHNVLVDLYQTKYLYTKYYLWVQLAKCINVPVIHIIHENNTFPTRFIEDTLAIKQLDYARDNLHSGIKSQINFSNILVEHIEKLNL